MERRKIALVTTKTCFQDLLKHYPYHSLMAKLQREQMENLIDCLTSNRVVCGHDDSEGYSCCQQDELQTENFDVANVSLHITILYRHAVKSVEGKASTQNDPQMLLCTFLSC